jgi:methyl-accepting chemotaxis protein
MPDGLDMLSRLRIGTKLLLAPGVVLVLLVLLSCAAYTAMLRQNASLDTIVRQRAAHIRAAAELASSAQHAHAEAYRVLTWISGSFPPSRIEPLLREVGAEQAAVERGFAGLAALTRGNPATRLCVQQARSAWRQYVPAVQDVIEIARLDDSISANAMSKAERAFAVVAQRLAELAQREQELAEAASITAANDFRHTVLLMACAVMVSIAVSLAITMAVRRALLAGIGAIDAAARGLASGDLTVRPRLDGDDEIAATSRTLDEGIRNLNGNLRTVLDSARAIGAASREIGLGKAGLPPRAGVRAANAQGADAMQALAVALGDHADSAHAARLVAQAAESAAHEGGVVAHRLVASMEDVRRAIMRLEQVGTLLEATLGPAAGDPAAGGPAAGEPAAGGPAAGGPAPGAPATRDPAAAAGADNPLPGADGALARRALLAVREARAFAREALAASQGGSAWAVEAGACMAGLADSAREMDDLVLDMGSQSREHARDLAGASQAILRVDAMNQQGTRMVEEAALAAHALQQQALDLSRAVAAFRLDETVLAGGDAIPKDAPEAHGAKGGHPYLRLASSRRLT